jgi:hypothetical protein
MGRWIGLQPYTGNGWIRNLTVTILYLAVYGMAIFSVAFSFRGDSGGEIRGGFAGVASEQLAPKSEPNFLMKGPDKPTRQAKIPPISGKLHLSLVRPTVIAPGL